VLRPALALVLLVLPPASLAEDPVPVAERIGEGIVRFFDSEETRAAAVPSVTLERPREGIGAPPPDFPVRPIFQIIQNRNAVRVRVEEGTSLYGAGEAPGPLLRNGAAITLWNLDPGGRGDDAVGFHQSHPWVLAVRSDGTSFGLLFDTTYRSRLDLTGDILFVTEGPPFPVFAIDRASPGEVVEALADLTGKMPLPPLWALGYHQGGSAYSPDERVREVAHAFREKKIPCDALWIGDEYADAGRSFTFHPNRFPDPLGLNEDLHSRGFRTVWTVDPGVRKERGFAVYESGTAEEVWVELGDGSPYVGPARGGDSVFPDFTSSAVRRWWAGLLTDFLANGIDAIRIDRNEPTVFDVWERTMPLSTVHRADEEIGGPDTHARYHNVYGTMAARATFEGMLLSRPVARPLVFARANRLGGSRFAASWGGGSPATWDRMDESISTVLSLGLSGQPFSGPEIGASEGACDGALYARWMGIGALFPLALARSGEEPIAKEPWAFGPEVEATSREALRRRYRLLPYFYTVFRETSVTGLPALRPLFFADPTDPGLRAEDDAFLVGSDILVAARTTPGGERSPILPVGDWKEIAWIAEGEETPIPGASPGAFDELPTVFLRAGAIVPLGPPMEHTGEKPLDPLTLLVRLDESGRAEGWLYEDDGESEDHRQGAYRLTRFVAEEARGMVSLGSRITEGLWQEPQRTILVRLLLDEGEKTAEWKGPRGIGIRVE
jgi:alpha-glucosidase